MAAAIDRAGRAADMAWMGLGGELAREAPRRTRWLGPALLASVALGIGCGGGDGNQASPSDLRPLLLPAGSLPVKVQRAFEWDNTTDFTVQGLSLPDASEPSKAVATIHRAGFEAGAGQLFSPPGGEAQAYSEVAKFESDAGANEVLDYLHAQDLLRPCSTCGVIARPLVVSGIPNAKGAHQAPRTGKVSQSGARQPFERYVIEFTIGPYLFVGKVTGRPGLVPARLFTAGVKSFYEHAGKQLD
jgi:hypothetical protein